MWESIIGVFIECCLRHLPNNKMLMTFPTLDKHKTGIIQISHNEKYVKYICGKHRQRFQLRETTRAKSFWWKGKNCATEFIMKPCLLHVEPRLHPSSWTLRKVSCCVPHMWKTNSCNCPDPFFPEFRMSLQSSKSNLQIKHGKKSLIALVDTCFEAQVGCLLPKTGWKTQSSDRKRKREIYDSTYSANFHSTVGVHRTSLKCEDNFNECFSIAQSLVGEMLFL